MDYKELALDMNLYEVKQEIEEAGALFTQKSYVLGYSTGDVVDYIIAENYKNRGNYTVKSELPRVKHLKSGIHITDRVIEWIETGK